MNITRNKKNISLLFYLAGLFLLFSFAAYFASMDNRLTDILFKIRYALCSREKITSYLVVLQLDDSTIKEYVVSDKDREPFSRIVDILSKGKSKTIFFDILFRLPGEPTGDALLLQSLKKADNIFFPVVFKSDSTGFPGDKTSRLLEKHIIYPENKTRISFPHITDALLPYEGFLESIKGIGGITLSPQTDGIIRKIPLLYSYKNGYLPSIVLASVCHFVDVPLHSIKILPPGKIVINNIDHPYFNESSLSIPVDNNGNMLINFAGPWEDSISSYSFAPFLSGSVPAPLPSLSKVSHLLWGWSMSTYILLI